MKEKIKWYDRKKGYGFIICPDSKKDIFFMCRDCLDNPDELEKDDLVHFILKEDNRGRTKGVDVLKIDFRIGVLINEES